MIIIIYQLLNYAVK